MKAYVINMHLLVPRSRSSAKVKVKYKGYISQKMAVSGAFVFHKHNLLFYSNKIQLNTATVFLLIRAPSLILAPPPGKKKIFTTQSRLLMILYKKIFETIVGKGENAGNQHFLLFPQCFNISPNWF